MPGAVRPFHRLEERNNGQPTDIRLRLMEGADIYQIAGNCRTSVEMIERVYALHIKATLDAAAINVRKARPNRPMAEPATPTLRNIDAWTSCCRLGAVIL